MRELIQGLGIDWKLLVAQAVNFFILFLILLKFFVKPLGQLMEERRLKIEAGLKKSEEAEKLIDEVKILRQAILRKTDQERQQIIKQAAEAKEKLISRLRQELEIKRQTLQEALEEEMAGRTKDLTKELEKTAPQILRRLAAKVFHRPELNQEFIQKILSS